MEILLNSSHFSTIFSHTHFFQHHFSSHCNTPEIKWLFLIFSWRIQTNPRPPAFFWFLRINIPRHVAFINKWYFWDGFWTFSKLYSFWRFSKWIPSIVPTLFSYCIRSHSTANFTCPWGGPPLSHDQAFRWSPFHCNGGTITSIHKPHFMSSIPWNFCNTFFPTLIWSYN